MRPGGSRSPAGREVRKRDEDIVLGECCLCGEAAQVENRPRAAWQATKRLPPKEKAIYNKF